MVNSPNWDECQENLDSLGVIGFEALERVRSEGSLSAISTAEPFSSPVPLESGANWEPLHSLSLFLNIHFVCAPPLRNTRWPAQGLDCLWLGNLIDYDRDLICLWFSRSNDSMCVYSLSWLCRREVNECGQWMGDDEYVESENFSSDNSGNRKIYWMPFIETVT